MVNILVLLVTIVLLTPANFDWQAVDIKTLFETKHTRNTRKAEAFNKVVWETGYADVYTIKAEIEVNDGMRSAIAEVICAPKIETQRANIKGGPYVWDLIFNFNPPEIYMQISENIRVKLDTTISCPNYSRLAEEEGFPFTDYSYLSVDIQHIADPVISCRFALFEGDRNLKGLKILPLQVVSVRKERVRDIITQEEYGPADRAIAQKQESSKPATEEFQISYDQVFYWSDKAMCWEGRRRGILECSDLAQKICPQPSEE